MGQCVTKDQKQAERLKKQYRPIIRENSEDSMHTEASIKSIQSSDKSQTYT